MLVEPSQDLGAIDTTRAPTRPLEPASDRWPGRDPRRFAAHELRNAHASLGRAPDEASVDIVVQVSDLDRFWHPSGRLSCKDA